MTNSTAYELALIARGALILYAIAYYWQGRRNPAWLIKMQAAGPNESIGATFFRATSTFAAIIGCGIIGYVLLNAAMAWIPDSWGIINEDGFTPIRVTAGAFGSLAAIYYHMSALDWAHQLPLEDPASRF